MKAQYFVAFVLLILLFFGFEASIALTDLSSQSWISQAIAGAGVFVALIAAVIALHSADRKAPKIKAQIDVRIDRAKPLTHNRSEIPPTQLIQLRHDDEVFHSEKVSFAITNESGFTLKDPTLTFRLPLMKQHPHRVEGTGAWTVGFNTNLYNAPEALRILSFGDTAILSNSNLPFWNDGDQFEFWIRMALDAGGSDPFEVRVSFNASNADGITETVTVTPPEGTRPKELLNQTGT